MTPPPPQPGVVLRSRLSVIDCAEYQRSTVSWTASGPRQSSARWRAFVSVWSRDLAHACVCVQFGATRNFQTPLDDAVGLHAPLVSISLAAVGGGKTNGHGGSCPPPGAAHASHIHRMLSTPILSFEPAASILKAHLFSSVCAS